MRALLLISLFALLCSCSSSKKIMKNCTKVGEIVWECESELK